MMLIIHIFIAVSSIAFTTYLYFRPSKKKFYAAYTLVGLTLASGTYLVVVEPVHMAQACITGLVYLAVVGVGIALAHKKLATEKLT